MALDSRAKRASSVGIGLLWLLAPPLPDGAISQGDRQHIAISYSGILADEADPDVLSAIALTGSFAQSISLTGSYASSVSLTGSYAPSISLTGSVE